MTIRVRLILWLGGILLASFALLAGVVRYEWMEQLNRMTAQGKAPEPVWQEVGEVLLFAGLPTTLFLLCGSWFLMRRLLAPITTLTQAAGNLQLDHLKEQLPRTHNGDELDRLTEVFNGMTTRLEKSVSRVREFTLHASHELKTPLTVMRAEIESALLAVELTPAQQELFLNQLEEIQRLTRIVDGLTFLAKSDAGQESLLCESLRFDDLVREIFTDAQMLAQPKTITVELDECEGVACWGDRHRLRQLLLNLTDNAIKYNQPGGRVTIALSRHNGMAALKIANTGPGIHPDTLGRVFDRFYRGDPSHNRDVEGCGLGLCIARSIAEAHGGTIAILSVPDLWTTATVTLPVSRMPES